MNGPAIVEIPSFFRNKAVKRLIFNKQGLKIEKLNSFDPAVFIAAENIVAFRFGAPAVRGYAFAIGRRYFIEVKDSGDNIHKIQFKSYYGVRRETYTKVWSEIITQLWNYYFSEICSKKFQLYKKLQVFDFAGVSFLFDGIRWDTKNKLLWNEIALSNYKTYFTVHHVQNSKQHKSFNFDNHWNAVVLQYLLKKITGENKEAH